MNRLYSAGLILALCACGPEEKPSTPPADPATTSAPAAPAIASEAEEPAAGDTAVAAVADHDVTGAYFPIDPLPADFAGLEHLSLANIDENAAPAPLNGFLRPKSSKADDFKLVQPTLSGRRLTFVTSTSRGVQYAFEGQFEVLGNFPENPPSYETVVLTGTLKRSAGGKTVASTPVRFRYEAGG